MQGVNIAKPSAAREKFLEAIQELTESGEIVWLPRIVEVPGHKPTKFFTYIHLVADALGLTAFGFGTPNATLQFDVSEASDNLCLAIAHQQGVEYGPGNASQAQYAKELAARQAK
jgi:hypothetical protein